MLVLSRQKDEEIIIGDRLTTLKVVSIRGNKIRLGIIAPGITVYREELYRNAIDNGGRQTSHIAKTTGMLVLSRQVDEQIMLCSNILTLLVTITIVDIRGSKVRIGVEAPRKLTVHRRKVFEEIHLSKQC